MKLIFTIALIFLSIEHCANANIVKSDGDVILKLGCDKIKSKIGDSKNNNLEYFVSIYENRFIVKNDDKINGLWKSKSEVFMAVDYLSCLSRFDNSDYIPSVSLSLFLDKKWGKVAFRKLEIMSKSDSEAKIYMDQMNGFVKSNATDNQ